MKTCAQCSAELASNRKKFCSRKCGQDWHNARQVWAERPDRELHNARKKADPETRAAKMREWRAAHPEQQKEYEHRHRIKHAEVLKQRNAKWREENRDYVLQKARERHAEIRVQANVARKARRDANLEIERARQRQSGYEARTTSPWLRLLAGAKGRAKKYNIPFTLTIDWARQRWTDTCELTGIPFRTDERGNGPKTFAASIDQIEPRKGYTPDNCRFVLWAVNALKHDGTDADMYLIAAALLDKKFSI